jgi:hypothetical protein
VRVEERLQHQPQGQAAEDHAAVLGGGRRIDTVAIEEGPHPPLRIDQGPTGVDQLVAQARLPPGDGLLGLAETLAEPERIRPVRVALPARLQVAQPLAHAPEQSPQQLLVAAAEVLLVRVRAACVAALPCDRRPAGALVHVELGRHLGRIEPERLEHQALRRLAPPRMQLAKDQLEP